MRKLAVIWISLIVFSVYVLSVFSQEVGPSTVGRAQTYSIPSTEYLGNRYCLSVIYNIKIDSLSEKASLRFTSKRDVEVQKVRVYFNVYGLPGDARIGIQGDDGGGKPSGTYLGYQDVTVISKEKWYVATLSPPVALSKNSVYHVVITPLSGYDADNYILIWVNYPNNRMYPYDQEPDDNLNSLFYDGDSWSVQDRDPEFMLDLTSGEYVGITYNFFSDAEFYGKVRAGEEFLVRGKSWVVKGVSAYLKRGTTPPEDDLFVSIYDVTDSSWVVRDEKFCSSGDVGASYSWVDHWFKERHVLEKGKTYRVFWESPGTSFANGYKMRRITSESLDPYAKVTYDGLGAYYVYGKTDPPTLTYLNSDVVYSLWLLEEFFAAVRRVPEEYQTIQGAINAAYPGDTISVSSGTYCEHVVVDKSVALFGENKNNTIIDGNGTGNVISVIKDKVEISGFTIKNGNRGIFLSSSVGSTVRGNTLVSHTEAAIELWYSNGTIIRDNRVSNNDHGIWLLFSSCGNTISDNVVIDNSQGIACVHNCDGNAIVGNTLASNSFAGIVLGGNSDNAIYRNNFIKNLDQVYRYNSSNTWDNGAEGNYWSDYAGEDLNGDGVGDALLPHKGVDNRPLMEPWSVVRVFDIAWGEETYQVITFCNSTVASLCFNQPLKQIGFNVTGPSGTVGFCNVTIPRQLLWADPPEAWLTEVDGTRTTSTIVENATHTSLYFTYTHSTHTVKITGTSVIRDITPPVAEAGPDQTVKQGRPVTFDGSVSSDNVGITSYEWSFVDVAVQTLTGVNPTYSFNTPGKYTVTLNVTDAVGNYATDTLVITVLDMTKPVADAGSDKTVDMWAVVTFDASASSDNVGVVSFEWDFGDGTNGTGVTITHTYAEPGSYAVTLTVRDATGNMDMDSITIVVVLPWWIMGAIAAAATAAGIALFAIILWRRRAVEKKVQSLDKSVVVDDEWA